MTLKQANEVLRMRTEIKPKTEMSYHHYISWQSILRMWPLLEKVVSWLVRAERSSCKGKSMPLSHVLQCDFGWLSCCVGSCRRGGGIGQNWVKSPHMSLLPFMQVRICVPCLHQARLFSRYACVQFWLPHPQKVRRPREITRKWKKRSRRLGILL